MRCMLKSEPNHLERARGRQGLGLEQACEDRSRSHAIICRRNEDALMVKTIHQQGYVGDLKCEEKKKGKKCEMKFMWCG